MKSDTVPPVEAVVLVVATFALLLFVGAAFVILLGYGPASVLAELLVALLPFAYMVAAKINIRSYVGALIKPKTVLLGIGIGAVLFFLDVFITNVLIAVLGVSQVVEESNKLATDLASSAPGVLTLVLSSSLAGVCEEFTFRGFLMNAIDRRYSFVPALFISSLAFGLFHPDPQGVYIIGTFLLGLVLGYVYHRWHSYITCATAHATLNLIVTAIVLLIR